ncbi:unnamed protein product [Thelazia callipaeda]|uniref:PDZ domain-containing protein n=1 Tax=Thelazia callipaeda TaxID=103827 RepID=A0A3P7LC78_THECL|nr:unnamed protein product [Thelazia callipaeda]
MQTSSSFLPYNLTSLSSLQTRAHFGNVVDGILPRTSPKVSRTNNRLNNEIHEISVPKSQLKTVDIQFEDKPSAAYQPDIPEKNNSDTERQNTIDGLLDVSISSNRNNYGNDDRKYFGFTVTGGKDKNAPLKIDAVIVGTPADEAGLQVGDLLMSINGEFVKERHYPCVVRMLHEAERTGSVQLRIQRSKNAVAGSFLIHKFLNFFELGPRKISEPSATSIDQQSTISFDQKRAMFDKKYTSKDSNNDICKGLRKQNYLSSASKWNTDKNKTYHENGKNSKLHASASLTATPAPALPAAAKTTLCSSSTSSSFSAIFNNDDNTDYEENDGDNYINNNDDNENGDDDNNDDGENDINEQRMMFINNGKSSNRYVRERFSSFTSLSSTTSCSITSGGCDPDYRVISLHDKPKPGKLSDFIPEVERKSTAGSKDQDDGASAYSYSFSRRGNDLNGCIMHTNKDESEAPLVLRNYDVTPVRSVNVSPIQNKISYWLKKDEAKASSLPRNIGAGYRRNGYVIPRNCTTLNKAVNQVILIQDVNNLHYTQFKIKKYFKFIREMRVFM